jgi:hypothetical protein
MTSAYFSGIQDVNGIVSDSTRVIKGEETIVNITFVDKSYNSIPTVLLFRKMGDQYDQGVKDEVLIEREFEWDDRTTPSEFSVKMTLNEDPGTYKLVLMTENINGGALLAEKEIKIVSPCSLATQETLDAIDTAMQSAGTEELNVFTLTEMFNISSIPDRQAYIAAGIRREGCNLDNYNIEGDGGDFEPEPGDIAIESITPSRESPAPGDDIDLNIKAANIGGEDKFEEFDVVVDSQTVGTITFNLGPTETRTKSFSIEVPDGQFLNVEVGGTSRTISISQPQPDIIVWDMNGPTSAVKPGDQVTISVTLRNRGSGQASKTYDVTVGGEKVGEIQASLQPNEEKTNQIKFEAPEKSQVNVVVGGDSTYTVQVDVPEGGLGGIDLSGKNLAIGAAALGGAAYLVSR